MFISNIIQRRQSAIKRAFPDSLDLLLICVEAGMSIEAAFNRVSTEIGQQSIEIEDEGGGWLGPETILLASTVLRFAGILAALLLFARLVVGPLVARLGSAPSAPLPARAGELELQLAGAGSDLAIAEGEAAAAVPVPVPA